MDRLSIRKRTFKSSQTKKEAVDCSSQKALEEMWVIVSYDILIC